MKPQLHKNKKKTSGVLSISQKTAKLCDFTQVKAMAQIQKLLKQLPEDNQYQIDQEMKYMRLIAECLELAVRLRLEQIPYVFDKVSLSKIITQLTQQPHETQIVCCLLMAVLKGCPNYLGLIENELYESLQITVELMDDKQSKEKRQIIECACIRELIQSIIKWYSFTRQAKIVIHRYSNLLENQAFKLQH